MDMLNKEKFKKDMAAFSFKQHQDVLTYLTHLEATGWTIEEAKEWIENEKKRLIKISDLLKNIKKLCPKCQSQMQLLPVNFSPGTQTEDNSNSVWICSNRNCLETVYNKKLVNEIILELNKS